MRYFLGIDDTDVLGHKPGTGRLARDLGEHLSRDGLRCAAVLRHQLLVDPRVPYTSHNSPACIVLDIEDEGAVGPLFEDVAGYVSARAADGSDPGICLERDEAVGESIVAWGLHAAAKVLTKAEASATAARNGTRLRELGGTGDGIIGALAAVGLTRYGNAGRFLEIAGGLRQFGESVDASALLDRGITPISTVRTAEPVPPCATIDTGDWLRPRLIGGRPVLFVEPIEPGSWRCSDRKKRDSHEEDHG